MTISLKRALGLAHEEMISVSSDSFISVSSDSSEDDILPLRLTRSRPRLGEDLDFDPADYPDGGDKASGHGGPDRDSDAKARLSYRAKALAIVSRRRPPRARMAGATATPAASERRRPLAAAATTKTRRP